MVYVNHGKQQTCQTSVSSLTENCCTVATYLVQQCTPTYSSHAMLQQWWGQVQLCRHKNRKKACSQALMTTAADAVQVGM